MRRAAKVDANQTEIVQAVRPLIGFADNAVGFD